jgi:ElaB/YqjD/DUF883 family membrane-anchored ribosome-binding protein
MSRNGRRSAEMERVAEQAWSNLTSTVESGGDLAKAVGRRTRNIVDEAGHKVSSTSKEARRRTDAAIDALAGRTPSKPWGPLIAVAAVGVALGWLSAIFGRQALAQARAMSEREEMERMTDEVVPAP